MFTFFKSISNHLISSIYKYLKFALRNPCLKKASRSGTNNVRHRIEKIIQSKDNTNSVSKVLNGMKQAETSINCSVDIFSSHVFKVVSVVTAVKSHFQSAKTLYA